MNSVYPRKLRPRAYGAPPSARRISLITHGPRQVRVTRLARRRCPRDNLGIESLSDGTMANKNDNDGDEIVVHLDPLIEDIVADFLQHRKENVASILDALEAADFDTVANIGHDIEGTGGAFGFSGMARIGRSLMEAARESSTGDIKRLAEELTSYLERLRIVYK